MANLCTRVTIKIPVRWATIVRLQYIYFKVYTMPSVVTALDFGSLTQVVQYLMEIDKLRSVQRHTKVPGTWCQKDARFARVLERTMPMLMNLHNEGQSWVENGISLEEVLERTTLIAEVHPELWHHRVLHLQDAQHQGWLKSLRQAAASFPYNGLCAVYRATYSVLIAV